MKTEKVEVGKAERGEYEEKTWVEDSDAYGMAEAIERGMRKAGIAAQVVLTETDEGWYVRVEKEG